MSAGIPITQAAKILRRHPATIRKWIAAGAPTVEHGSVGRGKGSLVRVDELRRWRAGSVAAIDDEALFQRLAVALEDTIKRDAVHERVGIHEGQCAGVLALTFERLSRNLMQRQVDLDRTPPEIARLCAIWLRWRASH